MGCKSPKLEFWGVNPWRGNQRNGICVMALLGVKSGRRNIVVFLRGDGAVYRTGAGEK